MLRHKAAGGKGRITRAHHAQNMSKKGVHRPAQRQGQGGGTAAKGKKSPSTSAVAMLKAIASKLGIRL